MPASSSSVQRISQFNNGANFALGESMPRHAVAAPAALIANTAYVMKVRFPKALQITTMSWYVGAAAGTVDAGIYSSVDDGVNLSRMGSTATAGGTTPITVAGASVIQSAALATPVNVLPDTSYWLAIVASTAITLTLGRLGAQSGLMFANYRLAALALGGGVVVLPTSITGHAITSNLIWVEAK